MVYDRLAFGISNSGKGEELHTWHSREFPIHSLRLTHKYDLDHLGSHYLFTNADNFVLSLSRMSNRKDTYRRLTMLEYTLELANNFSVTASLENVRQQESALYFHLWSRKPRAI